MLDSRVSVPDMHIVHSAYVCFLFPAVPYPSVCWGIGVKGHQNSSTAKVWIVLVTLGF